MEKSKLHKTEIGIIKLCKHHYKENYTNKLEMLRHYISLHYGYYQGNTTEVADRTIYVILKNLFFDLQQYEPQKLSNFFYWYDEVERHNSNFFSNIKEYEESQFMTVALMDMLMSLQIRKDGQNLYGITDEEWEDESWKGGLLFKTEEEKEIKDLDEDEEN